MELLHAMLGSLFTILITGSVSFIAYKVVSISSDIAEIKDAIKELQHGGVLPAEALAAAKNFPGPLPDLPRDEEHPERNFVLPPPISRRLDAERGIQRDPADDFSLGLKSSERRR
jgi:hypothetical protein